METMYVTHSPAQTEALARALASRLRPGDVIAFRGGLGAGKTAFTRGLAEGLNVTGEVSSPTFALVNEYAGPVPLYHFDMYRIADANDLYMTGFFDYLDGESILAIEWSENIADALPEDAITITLEVLDEHSRRITIEAKEDGRFADLRP